MRQKTSPAKIVEEETLRHHREEMRMFVGNDEARLWWQIE